MFVESAFKHGYDETEFYELLESGPLKLRSKRGLAGIFELYGRTFAGDYVHAAYRMEGERHRVSHAAHDRSRETNVLEASMKQTRPSRKLARTAPVRFPKTGASYNELARFFDRHDGAKLLRRGVTAIDRDHSDLERMLAEYWGQPNTKQLNIRIPRTAKRLIEKLARRKTVEVSTLVRMWVVEGMRREAGQP